MRKLIVWLPVLAMALVIFGFSGQGGEASGGLSHKVAAVLVDGAEQLHLIAPDEAKRQEWIEQLQFPVRKGAHMSEYAVFTALVYAALMVDGMKMRLRGAAAFGITVLFACSDEFHQLFVPGRSGRFADVLIDATGALIAVLICRAIDRRRKNC